MQYAIGKPAEDFTVPFGVKALGAFSFAGCTSLSYVSLASSVQTIGDCAFFKCSQLNSVRFSQNLSTIGASAFEQCTSLTAIRIPSDVSIINENTFSACTSLASVVIGDSVTSIAKFAFSGCSALASAYYNGTLEDWSDITIEENNHALTNATRYYYSENEPTEEGNFWHYVEGEITVWHVSVEPEAPTYSKGLEFTPNGDGTCTVTGIGTCTDADLKIPLVSPAGDRVTTIGVCAFQYCYSLTSVVIPDSVTSIGNFAFSDCSALTSVTIPASVTIIDYDAFLCCDTLISVTIAEGSQVNICSAFLACEALYTVYEYGVYVGDDENPYAVLVGLTDWNQSTYTIHEDTRFIGGQAFYTHQRLTSITIPANVVSIGDEAFRECPNLESVTFAEKSCLKAMGNCVFYCSALKSFTIPASVEYMGECVFIGTDITSIIFENTEGWWVREYRHSTSEYVPADQLADPFKAMQYLNTIYDIYDWYRK